MDPEVSERIVARRAEPDGLEEQLVKRLSEVRAEPDELAVADRVWQRMSERVAEERAGAGARWRRWRAGRCNWFPIVHQGWLSPCRPTEYQRILSAMWQAAGPVTTRKIGEMLGLDSEVRGKLEPQRGKLKKLADRGRLHERPDGKFTARP